MWRGNDKEMTNSELIGGSAARGEAAFSTNEFQEVSDDRKFLIFVLSHSFVIGHSSFGI